MALDINQKIMYKGNEVNVQDLPHGSSLRVNCICDYCGKIVPKILKRYYSAIQKHDGKYICKDCFNHNQELLRNRKEQTAKTCLEKYGVSNPMKTVEVQEKLSQIFLEKYGVKSAGQIEQSKEKRRNTNLKKYGVENPVILYNNSSCHSKEAREKAVSTCREKYGGIGFEKIETREKARIARLESGNIPTSSQQKQIHKIVQELYPNAIDCVLNYPLSSLGLDIALFLDNIKIDIEVDGQYWHQDANKDRRRDEFVKSSGFKVLRIKFNKKIPTKQEINNAIEKLIATEHSYNEIYSLDYQQQ